MFKLLTLCFLVSFATAGIIQIQNCSKQDESIGKDIILTIDSFPDNTSEVTLIAGQTYTFQISFTAGSDSTSLTNKLYGDLGIITIPWNGVDKDACKGLLELSNGCLIKAGSKYNYKNFLTLQKFYPSMSLTILWKLVDSNDKNQVCFRLPAKVKDY